MRLNSSGIPKNTDLTCKIKSIIIMMFFGGDECGQFVEMFQH